MENVEEGGFRLSFLHGGGLMDWMCCFIAILSFLSEVITFVRCCDERLLRPLLVHITKRKYIWDISFCKTLFWFMLNVDQWFDYWAAPALKSPTAMTLLFQRIVWCKRLFLYLYRVISAKAIILDCRHHLLNWTAMKIMKTLSSSWYSMSGFEIVILLMISFGCEPSTILFYVMS